MTNKINKSLFDNDPDWEPKDDTLESLGFLLMVFIGDLIFWYICVKTGLCNPFFTCLFVGVGLLSGFLFICFSLAAIGKIIEYAQSKNTTKLMKFTITVLIPWLAIFAIYTFGNMDNFNLANSITVATLLTGIPHLYIWQHN